MAFWSSWFSGKAAGDDKPAASEAYKGYVIEARPFKEGGQYQLAGMIVKGEGEHRQEHRFIRADRFSERDVAASIAISKGRLIIDQMGDRLFKA